MVELISPQVPAPRFCIAAHQRLVSNTMKRCFFSCHTYYSMCTTLPRAPVDLPHVKPSCVAFEPAYTVCTLRNRVAVKCLLVIFFHKNVQRPVIGIPSILLLHFFGSWRHVKQHVQATRFLEVGVVHMVAVESLVRGLPGNGFNPTWDFLAHVHGSRQDARQARHFWGLCKLAVWRKRGFLFTRRQLLHGGQETEQQFHQAFNLQLKTWTILSSMNVLVKPCLCTENSEWPQTTKQLYIYIPYKYYQSQKRKKVNCVPKFIIPLFEGCSLFDNKGLRFIQG